MRWGAGGLTGHYFVSYGLYFQGAYKVKPDEKFGGNGKLLKVICSVFPVNLYIKCVGEVIHVPLANKFLTIPFA